jgi:hypothetical protein
VISFWAFLVAAAGPLVLRVLIMLGFASVSYTGMMALIEGLIASAQSSWSSLPSAVLGLVSLAGLPTAVGLLFGAMVTRTTIWIGVKATRLVFGGASA